MNWEVDFNFFWTVLSSTYKKLIRYGLFTAHNTLNNETSKSLCRVYFYIIILEEHTSTSDNSIKEVNTENRDVEVEVDIYWNPLEFCLLFLIEVFKLSLI